jgi:putative transposase
MTKQRAVFHYGIELEGLKYNSLELGELRRRTGATLRVDLTFDPGDLGHINVLDPRKGSYIRVPALNQAYASRLSLWQHKVIRRYTQRQLDSRTDMLALAQAKAEIRELVDRDFHRKSTRGRKRHARFLSEPMPNPFAREGPESPRTGTTARVQHEAFADASSVT